MKYFEYLVTSECANCNEKYLYLVNNKKDITNRIVYYALLNGDTVDVYKQYDEGINSFIMSVPQDHYAEIDKDIFVGVELQFKK